MRKPKHRTVYHVGDIVKVVNPRFVERVGYPLIYTALIEEFESHPNLKKCLVLLGLANEHASIDPRGRMARDFVIGCARAAVHHRGFGGRERKIHYRTEEPIFLRSSSRDEDADIELVVLGKRTAKTGTYYPPTSGYSWEGEYDYEPGGLTDEKTHVLLQTALGEIEETDVELVRRAAAKPAVLV